MCVCLCVCVCTCNPISELYREEDFRSDSKFSYSIFMRTMGISECRCLTLVIPYPKFAPAEKNPITQACFLPCSMAGQCG